MTVKVKSFKGRRSVRAMNTHTKKETTPKLEQKKKKRQKIQAILPKMSFCSFNGVDVFKGGKRQRTFAVHVSRLLLVALHLV